MSKREIPFEYRAYVNKHRDDIKLLSDICNYVKERKDWYVDSANGWHYLVKVDKKAVVPYSFNKYTLQDALRGFEKEDWDMVLKQLEYEAQAEMKKKWKEDHEKIR